MGIDHSNPYIQSTTVLCDIVSYLFQSRSQRRFTLGNHIMLTGFQGQNGKRFKFYYVSLLKTLTVLLSNFDILHEINHPHKSSALNDFCDGSISNYHPHFSTDESALEIVGYVDDLEICNPLGSYHKLCCLFFSLGNIRPIYRSTFFYLLLVKLMS